VLVIAEAQSGELTLSDNNACGEDIRDLSLGDTCAGDNGSPNLRVLLLWRPSAALVGTSRALAVALLEDRSACLTSTFELP
jgi:hypothetical protein